MFHNHMPQRTPHTTIHHQLQEIKNQNDKVLREISEMKEIVEQLKDNMVVIDHSDIPKTQTQTAVAKGWLW